MKGQSVKDGSGSSQLDENCKSQWKVGVLLGYSITDTNRGNISVPVTSGLFGYSE